MDVLTAINKEINRLCLKLEVDTFLTVDGREALQKKVDKLVEDRERLRKAYLNETDETNE